MPPIASGPFVVRDHDHAGLEIVGLAVQRQDGLAGLGRAHRPRCPSPCRRRTHGAAGTRSKVTKLVMSTSAEIGRRPMDGQTVLQPLRRGAVLDAPEIAAGRVEDTGFGALIDLPLDRALETCP